MPASQRALDAACMVILWLLRTAWKFPPSLLLMFVYGHLSGRNCFMQPTLSFFFSFCGFYCNLAVYLNIWLNWPLQVSEFVVRILRFLFGLPRHHSCSFHGWRSEPRLFHASPHERVPFVSASLSTARSLEVGSLLSTPVVPTIPAGSDTNEVRTVLFTGIFTLMFHNHFICPKIESSLRGVVMLCSFHLQGTVGGGYFYEQKNLICLWNMHTL